MASSSHAARARRPSPAALEQDDAFAARAAQLAAWAKKNARIIMIVTAVAAVAVAAFLYVRLSQAARERAASAQYLNVAAAAQSGVTGAPQLETFIRSYDGTTEADEARLEVARVYLGANQPQKALPHLRAVAGSGGRLEYQGKMALAAALAQTNDRAGALRTYNEAAESAPLLFQRQEARSQAALLHEAAGDWKAAADLYRQMLADTEAGSVDRSIVEMRLAEAEGRLTARR